MTLPMTTDRGEETPPKAYQVPHFSGPKTCTELELEAKSTSPHVLFFDEKFKYAREKLIFMAETKVWQELLEQCADRSGVNAASACKQLFDIVHERTTYYNSNYNPNLRPTLTPGLPPIFEAIPEYHYKDPHPK